MTCLLFQLVPLKDKFTQKDCNDIKEQTFLCSEHYERIRNPGSGDTEEKDQTKKEECYKI